MTGAIPDARAKNLGPVGPPAANMIADPESPGDIIADPESPGDQIRDVP